MKALVERVKTWVSKQKFSGILSVLFILFFISISILIFGRVYEAKLPKLVEEINNGAIGAILTAITTVLLLGQQTNRQQELQKDSKVYGTKLRYYREFLETLIAVFDDGKVDGNTSSTSSEATHEELNRILFHLAKVRLVSDGETLDNVLTYLDEVLEVDDEGNRKKFDYERFSEKLMYIVGVLRSELEIKESSDLAFGDKELSMKVRTTLGGLIMTPPEPSLTSVKTVSDEGTKRVWFVNVGDRPWEDMRKHGYWQAGAGARYRKATQNLGKGDRIFVYSSGIGYLGTGIVASDEPEEMAKFRTSNGTALYDVASRKWKDYMKDLVDAAKEGREVNLDDTEWARRIEWTQGTLRDEEKPLRFDDMFVGLQTACRIRNPEKVEALRKAFELREL